MQKQFFDLDKTRFMNFWKPENPIFLRLTRTANHKVDVLRVVT